MDSIIKLEQHINEIYHETAKRILLHTPQLFVYKENTTGGIQAHGSCVLLQVRNTYYLATARHCIIRNGELIKIGLLILKEDGKNYLRLISGYVCTESGKNDRVDLALVKLIPGSAEMLLGQYDFLNFDNVSQTKHIEDEKEHLLVGYPASKTNIDNGRRKLKSEPFVYIAKSKDNKTYSRLQYDKTVNTLLHFDKRRGRFAGENHMIMNPEPAGISGSGLWYIHSCEIANPMDAEYSLMGIMIEHYKDNRLMIATKSEELARLLQASINKFGSN